LANSGRPNGFPGVHAALEIIDTIAGQTHFMVISTLTAQPVMADCTNERVPRISHIR